MTTRNDKEKSVFLSLVTDFLLFIPDVVAALMANSVTLWADVLKCGNELLATFLSWLALRMVHRGRKVRFDYGLGKLENITGVIVAGVMFISLFIVLHSAFERLRHPMDMHPGGVWLAMILMTVGVIANTSLWIKNYRVGRRQFSPIIEAQWRMFRTKAFSDLIVLAALTLSMTLRAQAWAIYIDPAASLLIAGFILHSIWGMLSNSFYDLLDRTLDESLQLLIVKELATHFDHYEKIHGVRSRRSGSHVYVDLMLEFDGDKKMAEIQAIINRMETALERSIPGCHVLIAPTTRERRAEDRQQTTDDSPEKRGGGWMTDDSPGRIT
ncbi:MAG: cation diffusion facilitator family transporter [Kiritimatiellota bacterium]|nr:cation diffusion facilitator family transporter [Kiritimatiellota bacterium]